MVGGTEGPGIDTANDVVGELALLLGAVGFRADSPIANTRGDLGELLYADGIHDRHSAPSGSSSYPPRHGCRNPPADDNRPTYPRKHTTRVEGYPDAA